MRRWLLGAVGLLLLAAAVHLSGETRITPGDRPDPRTTIDLVEEFCGTTASGSTGSLGWSNNTITEVAGVAGHPCIRNMATGGTINTIRSLRLNGTSSTGAMLPAEPFELTVIVRPQTITVQELRFGLMDNSGNAPPANGIYFEQDTAVDGDWACVTRATSTNTRTTTGVAVAANTWVTLRMARSGSSILFYKDDALVCTHTTNIPTAAVMLNMQQENLEAVDKNFDVDYARLRVVGVSR